MIKKWEELPKFMRNESVKKYYDVLKHKRLQLALKRVFDIVVSLVMLVILAPVMLVLAILIKIDSKGSIFFRQERVTQYGKVFKIFKFRTMVNNADKIGSLVTVGEDSRITRVGTYIRKARLDEIPQLLNVLVGEMSFVGTRPEVKKYVDEYTEEMYATLLLPAGITSEASIFYKDESNLLDVSENVDETYIKKVLPGKMHYNLKELENFTFFNDIKVMFMTFFAVLGKEYEGNCAEIINEVEEREAIYQ